MPNIPDVTSIGFDVSLTSTGVAIWRHKHLIKSGLIKTRKKDFTHQMQRLTTVASKIIKVVHAVEPDIVCIEDYAFSQNSKADALLKQLGGIIRHQLYIREVPFVLVGIGQLKKYATGNGSPKTKKTAVAEAVKQRWGFTARTLDETDAFVLAQIGRALVAQGALDWSLTHYQKSVIQTIIKHNNANGNLDLQTWELRP